MANDKTSGLLTNIGLGPVNEQELLMQRAQRVQPQGNGTAAGLAQLFGNLGAQSAPIIGGLAGLTRGKSFKEGMQATQDNAVAEELGTTVPMLHKRRQMQEKMAAFTPKSSDSIDQQIETAQEAIRLAQANGDQETALKAMQQITALKKQKQEMVKAGLANEDAAQSIAQDDANFRKKMTTGIEIALPGQNPEGEGSQAMFDSNPESPTFGKWIVSNPDGTTDVRDTVTPARKSTSVKQFETPQAQAVQQAGGAKSFAGNRGNLTAAAANASNAGAASELFLAATDPQALIGLAGKAQQKIDQAHRVIESTATLLHGADDKPTWNGKEVSPSQQRRGFVSAFVDRFKDSDPADIVPPGMLDQMKGNSAAYEQWLAITGEMTYLNARQMEPANRGLSDSDVERAEIRVGGNTQNPLTFLDRQLFLNDRDLAMLDTLGVEFTDTHNNDRQALVDAQYNPEHIAQVRESLQQNGNKLRAARSAAIKQQNGTDIREMSLEEIDAAIAAEEAKQGN